jgi:hypothetical protein
MPDIATQYVLTTPAGTITFNDGSSPQYYIQSVTGIGQPPLRVPQDQVPFGDGGLVYRSFRDARHPLVEGIFLITDPITQNEQLAVRNDMESDLFDALESILAPATGTFAWTPYGGSARSLTVHSEIPLECGHDQNFLVVTFVFGLVAPDPAW